MTDTAPDQGVPAETPERLSPSEQPERLTPAEPPERSAPQEPPPARTPGLDTTPDDLRRELHMRAEEGDESINDYADQARQTQKEVTGPHTSSWLGKILRFFGSGRKGGTESGGTH